MINQGKGLSREIEPTLKSCSIGLSYYEGISWYFSDLLQPRIARKRDIRYKKKRARQQAIFLVLHHRI